MDKARRTFIITVDTASKIASAAERMAITRGEVANLILSMAVGSLESIISQEQLTLGSSMARVKGTKFTCPTETVNVDISKAQRLSDIAKTLRCSSTWLFEWSASDVLERILLVNAWNRHDLPPPIASHVYTIEQTPYTPAEVAYE